METLRCVRCEQEFEWGRAKRYCPPCAKALGNEQKHAYKVSARGREVGRAVTARWLASARGREYVRAYEASHRDETRERVRRWFRTTGKGRALGTKSNCIRKGVPYANAVVVAKAVGDGEARCYWCGCIATDVDHVFPIAMARVLGMVALVDDYVAAMCARCHKAKSIMDRTDIYRLKRLLAIA